MEDFIVLFVFDEGNEFVMVEDGGSVDGSYGGGVWIGLMKI